MVDVYGNSDGALLRLMGEKVKELRLAKNLTQARLQELSGVHRTMISDMENGKNTSVVVLLQVLRGLEALYLMEPFFQPAEISPLTIAKLQGKKRRRASSPRRNQI